MYDDIQLNFINRSADAGNNTVVFHQKNEADPFSWSTLAWRVIKNSELNGRFSFPYSPIMEISVSDVWGNVTLITEAQPGKVYEIVEDYRGGAFRLSDRRIMGHPSTVEMWNMQKHSVLNLNCHRNGNILATKDSVGPRESAAFQFESSIFVAVLPETEDEIIIEDGVEIDSEFLLPLSTELHLGHIESADIIMTGGGSGPNAEPFQFSLENIQMKTFNTNNDFGRF